MVYPASQSALHGSSGLAAFHNPQSVVVIGASAKRSKWGYWLASGALLGQSERAVYLVNRHGAELDGHQSYLTVSDLPEVPELAVLAVPGHAVSEVVSEALEFGVRAFLVIASRVPDQAELYETLLAYEARMVGPNSLGVYSAETKLQLLWGRMQPGSLAVVSQSGQLGSEIAVLGSRVGVGISRFVSVGNQVDVHAVDVLRSLLNDPLTKTIGLYLEDFTRARELFGIIRELSDSGVAVVLLTTGSSSASKALAKSHTGAMTSSAALIDAACRGSGAVRVRTPAQLVEIAAYVGRQPRPQGPRISVISDSGGQGGIAADEAEHLGLVLPEHSAQLRQQLLETLPDGASARNPIDLAGAGEADLWAYASLAEKLADSGEADAVVLSGYFGSYAEDSPELYETELAVAHELAKPKAVPVVVHSMEPYSEISTIMRELGLMVVGRIEDALIAINGAYQTSAKSIESVTDDGDPFEVGEEQLAVRAELMRRGIPFPQVRGVRTAEEAAAAAEELGFPVVLKAPWLPHKTEMGGVVLGLATADDVHAAFIEISSRLGVGEYTIEKQDTRPHVAEFVVSARWDHAFGPVVTVGYGGTETEVWSDIALEIAPVSVETALKMIRSLKSSQLLNAWRGRPALNAYALADIVSKLSRVITSTVYIQEIELNPVRVGPEESIAVDCLGLVADAWTQSEPLHDQTVTDITTVDANLHQHTERS
jgi:acyl-CoA synthetase (NDP forming)